jgi:outer membrane protein OmpA-like peptidoglycan-associated protein
MPGKPRPHKTYTATLDSSALFQPNSAVFTASKGQVLTELQPVIKGWRQGLYSHVTVVGHSAQFGSAAAALLLSQQRAAAVAGLLRLHGVSAVTFKGVGFDQLAAPKPKERQ